MTQRVTGQRFRQRKLSTKQNLQVLREHEVDVNLDEEAQRNIPRIETGVEKGEEIVSTSNSPLPTVSLLFRCSVMGAGARCRRCCREKKLLLT